MSLENVTQLQRTGFQIPRFTDKVIVEKLDGLVKEGGFSCAKSVCQFTFSDHSAEFSGGPRDPQLDQLLNLETVSMRTITFQLSNSLRISVERPSEGQPRRLVGNQDMLWIDPAEQGRSQSALEYTKLIALARKHFNAGDTKPFVDYLDEGSKQLYQAREQDLQRLERMQEDFFKSMTAFTLDQQNKQQEFQRQLETEFASHRSKLEHQYQERLAAVDAKEAEVKRIRAEIDERDNRQARRAIYKELKSKLDDRNNTFELTKGTQDRRRIPFFFTVAMLLLFAGMFWFCFRKNVMSDAASVNWVAVGSQIGFAIAFIGTATFFIRWSNQWFQKHADEEFKLKRLDLDIDRANWLVELAMEWKNITKSEIPTDLIDKLSRSLFLTEESKEIAIHPAETLLSGIFGKAGSINVEFPTKVNMQRSDLGEGKKPS